MGIAEQYFAERDCNTRLNITSPEELWNWVLTGGGDRLTASQWELNPGTDLFFRGQPNIQYGLSSSLYRICYSRTAPDTGLPIRVDEPVIARAEREILAAMRQEGIGRLMTDGELLAVLQHHGIPTRLIDVSVSPLEALFFAIDQEHSADGRLFMLHIHPDDSHWVDTIDFAKKKSLEWDKFRAKREWTERVALVKEAPLDPRMHAQRGRFLVGGLNKRYSGRDYRANGERIPGERYAEVSTLGINFLKSSVGKPNRQWKATGWTLRVNAEWKPMLLELLAKKDISHDSMYPPLGEVRRLALKVAKDAVSHPA